MSAFYLDPKTVEPTAWKKWHLESWVMWKRLDWGWQFLFPIATLLAFWGVTSITVQCHAWLLLLTELGCLWAGLFLVVIAWKVMGNTRCQITGNEMRFEMKPYIKWLFRSAIVPMAFVLLVGGPIILMLGETEVKQNQEQLLATFFVANGLSYVWILKPGGLMGMDFFLRVKQSLGTEIAQKLEFLGRRRNRDVLLKTTQSLIVAHVVVVLVSLLFPPALIFLPWLMFHTAGVVLSAWHDIFEPDGGVREKSKNTQKVEIVSTLAEAKFSAILNHH